MEKDRTQKVVGMSSKEMIDDNDPRSPRNRRVTIILLRGSHMALQSQYIPADRDILSVTPQDDVRASEPAPVPSQAPEAAGSLSAPFVSKP